MSALPDGHEWRHFHCADCEGDEPFQVLLPVPATASHDAGCEIDFCPRCEGYLGVIGHGEAVTITPVPRGQREAAS